MIQQQLILFFVGLGFGILSRFFYVAVTKLEKAVNLKPVTIIFDILMTGIAVIAFSLMLFFVNDGVFLPYILISSIIGFVFVSFIGVRP